MTIGYQQFADTWGERAQLAWDTLALKATASIPAGLIHVMDIGFLEQFAGRESGDYAADPEAVYTEFQKRAGGCFVGQFIPRNPLTMGAHGYEADTQREATTGAEEIVLDGIAIDSPEAVVEHLERIVFPRMQAETKSFDPDDPAVIDAMIDSEVAVQKYLGPDLLKGPYSDGFQDFPYLRYGAYGYANYFMAYALFADVIERDFRLQADLAVLHNRAAAKAIITGGLPRMVRLDHDMADSRGTLVNIKTLDEIWFPQFARSIQPFLDAGIRLTWHCDGNLMEMVPRLLACGLGGFQGFQYEDGMDYEQICRMTTRDGDPLLIQGGVSVTTTLPHGTPQDVRDQLKWLVETGPPVGLVLGCSSSAAPGIPHENLRTLIEGLQHYHTHGRG